MTRRQAAAQAILSRLKAGDVISSKEKIDGYSLSDIITMLAGMGHNIKRVRVKQGRRRIHAPFQFPEANGYVKYTYINGPKQPSKED